MQGIVEMMKTLVSVVNNLSQNTANFVYGSYKNIIYQNISEDWILLEDSVFTVRFSLLLVQLESPQWFWLVGPKSLGNSLMHLNSEPPTLLCASFLPPRTAAIVKLSQHFNSLFCYFYIWTMFYC